MLVTLQLLVQVIRLVRGCSFDINSYQIEYFCQSHCLVKEDLVEIVYGAYCCTWQHSFLGSIID